MIQKAIIETLERRQLMTGTPDAPSTLVAKPDSMTQVTLNWADNSTDETGFKVERSDTGTGSWTLLDTTAANITSYRDSTVSGQKVYYYRARATNSAGDSSNTQIISVSTATNPYYKDDFESGSTIDSKWSDASIVASPTGEHFPQPTSSGTSETLSLSDLPKHNEITVNLDLYVIGDWHGANSLSMTYDGHTPLNATFSNVNAFLLGNTQTFDPHHYDGAGGDFPARNGSSPADLGGSGDDSLYGGDSIDHISFKVNSDAASGDLVFTGGDGTTTKFGIDNITISLDRSPANSCNCPHGGLDTSDSNAQGPVPSSNSPSTGINQADGTVTVSAPGLSSGGNGGSSQSPTISSLADSGGGGNFGNGVNISQLPTLRDLGGGSVSVETAGNNSKVFTASSDGTTFSSVDITSETLTKTSGDTYTLIDANGSQFVFYGLDAAIAPAGAAC